MPILFFVLWIIFNGRLTLEIAIFGAVISALIYAFAVKVMDYSPASDLRIFRNLPVFLFYCMNLIVEIVKASISVMKIALSRHAVTDPVVVEFDSEFEEQSFCDSCTLPRICGGDRGMLLCQTAEKTEMILRRFL